MFNNRNFVPHLIYVLSFLLWGPVFGIDEDQSSKALIRLHEYSYRNIGNWYSINPRCSGSLQSPIDINMRQTKQQILPKFTRSNYYIEPIATKITKGKFNLMVLPVYEDNHPMLSGGPLEEPYRFNHIAFHWGKGDNIGSEHAINGKKFPLEVQAVHYNEKYESYSEALNAPNGIAIVSYLFYINDKNTGDLALDLIQKSFEMLATVPTGEIELDYAFPISLLIPPIYKRYVTYNGSLTLPPCSENVIWIVNYKPRSITMLEMEKFRMLYNNSESLVNNFRPIQMTNQRDIYIVK